MLTHIYIRGHNHDADDDDANEDDRSGRGYIGDIDCEE